MTIVHNPSSVNEKLKKGHGPLQPIKMLLQDTEGRVVI